ncbi:ATP-dependent DNA ligase [Paenibacillus glycanilyticus]|uniref:SPBc2 prophage-derived DNA ligase-like protein LigB n=1 Tax=Paenibacillus glycanilyticus TaxID=126569 RepID=A0ABQ6GK69_9BACL|nr:ATP-dependent DNA ligase [Paenibacillus glycanilyticus]GLX70628.1 SPBc2 prophage-derived DNA ligase-like protein LigB [Paenibacillus glycanilyticus]
MFISPMLPEQAEQSFDSEEYVFEPKFNGHRLILSFINGQVNMYTKHNNAVTRQYPELFHVPVDNGMDVVFDGEAVMVRDDGTHDFDGLIQRFQLSKLPKIKEAARTHPVHYFVFDILYLNGQSLTHLPLIERKRLLAQILQPNGFYHLAMSIEQQGKALFQFIEDRGLTGIVAKRKNSTYASARSDEWLAIRNYQYTEVAICGYKRKEFGWLIAHDGQTVGCIDGDIPADVKQTFYTAASSMITGQDKRFVYVKPTLKVKVRFRDWTSSNMLRSPEFVSFAG